MHIFIFMNVYGFFIIICPMLAASSRARFLSLPFFFLKYYVILFGMNHISTSTHLVEFSQPSILIIRNVLREIWPSQCERLLYKNNNEGRRAYLSRHNYGT